MVGVVRMRLVNDVGRTVAEAGDVRVVLGTKLDQTSRDRLASGFRAMISEAGHLRNGDRVEVSVL